MRAMKRDKPMVDFDAPLKDENMDTDFSSVEAGTKPEGSVPPKPKVTAEDWAKEKFGLKFDAMGGIDYLAIGKEFHKNGTNRNGDAALFMAMRAQRGGAVGQSMSEKEFDAAIEKAANTKFKG